KAAAAVSDQIDVPKTIVTNGVYVDKWPPGWGASFEFYPNDPATNYSMKDLPGLLQTYKAIGATEVTITIGSWSANIPIDQYKQELDALKAKGIDIDGVSAYIWTQMTDDQKEQFIEWMNQFQPSDGSQGPPPPVGGDTNPSQKPKKPATRKPNEKNMGGD